MMMIISNMKMMMVSNMKMMMVSNIKILIVLLLLVEMVTFSSFSFCLFFVCWKMILFVLKIIVIVFSFNNCWVKSSVHLNTSFSKIVCSKIDRLFNKIVCSPKNDRFLVKTSSFSKGLVQKNFRLIKTTISFTKSVGKFLWSLKNDCFIKFGRTINYCFSCTFSKSIVLWTILNVRTSFVILSERYHCSQIIFLVLKNVVCTPKRCPSLAPGTYI